MEGVDVVAVHDSGGVRPPGYAAEFAKENEIKNVCDTIEQVVEGVDAGIVHSANWDLHIEHALPFIEAGKPVLIDKPMVGNLRDLNTLLRLEAKHKTLIMGGSSARYAYDIQDLLAQKPEMGEICAGWCQGQGDFFNYGIHTMELFQGFFGAGVVSVRHVAAKGTMDVFCARYADDTPVFYVVGSCAPWFISISASNGVFSREIAGGTMYKALIEKFVEAIRAGEAPISLEDNLECIKVALAAKMARREGCEVYLQDLTNEEFFDGDAFAEEYAKARQ